MQHLPTNTLLQGGKYKIERVLGQGGFGITYLAVQVGLNRQVAIKEFFMREYCNRDTDTSHVTVGSEGSRDVVEKFRSKFVKEAQNIACLKHPHIISIHDVFEENGTAYYVMEYLDRGSLAELVKRCGRLSESDALRYIRQIADALRYIHERKMNHLDVKPANILIDDTDGAMLIDFGLSKRYDDEGNQTSTTPVGISHGYAPLEQYKKGGVGTFSPSTDIYSLGATLYKLVTGDTPPDANDILTEGFSSRPDMMSDSVYNAIVHAMQPNKNVRPQSMEAFLALLDAEDEVTVIAAGVEECVHSLKQSKKPANESMTWKRESGLTVLLLSVIACAIVLLFSRFWPKWENITSPTPTSAISDNRTIYMVNGVEFAMIKVEGGTFAMGSSDNDSDANKDEKPIHQVTLNNFAIGETEVTQELWQAVMGGNPSKFTNNPKHPVEQVSWNDCQEFISKLNSLTGMIFHLPTEAEWEYAARGGQFSKGYKYSGSDEIDSIAWYDANASNTTHAVKGKRPNELGLYDMSGNVWEWCDDLYGSYSSPSTAAQTNRVLRGGGWRNDPKGNRVAFRLNGNSGKQLYTIGLRLAMSIGEPNASVIVQSVPVIEDSVDLSTTLLYVTTTPSSVVVYVDGQKIGTTPIEDKEILHGSHELKLSKVGYQDKTFTRTFGDKPVVINEILDEIPKEQQLQTQTTTTSNTSGSKKSYIVNGVSFTMVCVPGGTFTMGASVSDSDAYSDEKPAHQVTLSSYSIGETEVTQALWKAVMGNNPSYSKGDLQRPVNVSWNDCQEFIRKLNTLTGATFRLPTEAEWEYAARGGRQSRGYKYSGSDNLGTVAWYDGNSSSTTHPVKGKQPNELGLYDMSGNVCEWCSDGYSSSYYASSPKNNPQGPSSGSDRVLRGGSWFNSARNCRVTVRFNKPLDQRNVYYGLRLAQ